jgi:hypothetical protein
MRTVALVLAVAVAALFANAWAARAADTACAGLLSGIIDGNVVVPQGASCTMSDVTVRGNVRILENASASLTVDATQQPTTIDGNVQANHCASALFEGGVTVTGSVQIQQCAQHSGFVGPGIKIGGDFQCINNGGGCQASVDSGEALGLGYAVVNTAGNRHASVQCSARSRGISGVDIGNNGPGHDTSRMVLTQVPWDYLHPNHAGYMAMGEAVDIQPFAPSHHH